MARGRRSILGDGTRPGGSEDEGLAKGRGGGAPGVTGWTMDAGRVKQHKLEC